MNQLELVIKMARNAPYAIAEIREEAHSDKAELITLIDNEESNLVPLVEEQAIEINRSGGRGIKC